MNSTSISITRREISICLLAAAASSALPSWWAGAKDDETSLRLNLPPVGDPYSPSFEVFLALSQIVLMRTDLDIPFARQMFQLFLREPWGPKHVSTAYAALRNVVITRAQRGGREAVEQATLPYGERWFISHLVTTWYTGVYYHPEEPTQWMTLHGAVMFDPTRGLIPKPYEQSVGFGKWADPPKGGSAQ